MNRKKNFNDPWDSSLKALPFWNHVESLDAPKIFEEIKNNNLDPIFCRFFGTQRARGSIDHGDQLKFGFFGTRGFFVE